MASKFTSEITKATFKVLDNLLDLSLYVFFMALQNYDVGRGKKSSEYADYLANLMVAKIRRKSIRSAFWKASNKGYISKKGKHWQITQQGMERLNSILPKYYSKRPWDGKIYLITYDIPENRKRDRDLLREYLKRLGCGMLQASVWLTPYNPRGSLKQFITEKKLFGWVIISDIGEDGSVGLLDLKELMAGVYKLGVLNSLYQEFIRLVKEKRFKGPTPGLKYLSILKDDPQLPFELLPSGWLGDRAYGIYKKFLSSKASGRVA